MGPRHAAGVSFLPEATRGAAAGAGPRQAPPGNCPPPPRPPEPALSSPQHRKGPRRGSGSAQGDARGDTDVHRDTHIRRANETQICKKKTITKKAEAPSLVQSPTASGWEQHGLRDCPEPVDVLALPPASRPQSGKAAAASCAPWLLARCEEIPDRFKFGEPAHLSVHVCPPSVDVQMLPKMAAAASFMPSLLEAIAFHDLHVLTLGQ